MPDFAKLPPEVKHIPEIVDLRLTRLERRVTELETHGHHPIHLGLMQGEVKTPIGTFPPLILLALLGLIAIKPELVSTLLAK